MNILHVIQRYWPYVGGSERYLQEVSERLARDGHNVVVCTTDAFDLEHFWTRGKKRVEQSTEQRHGVQIRRFPVRHVAPMALAYPIIRRAMLGLSVTPLADRLVRRLAQLTPWVPGLARALAGETQRYDVVAGMNIVFDSLLYPMLEYAQRLKSPVVIYPLTHLGEQGDARVRRYYTMRHQIALLRRADALILQNDLERDALVELGLPGARMEVVGTGVNADETLGGDADRFRSRHNLRNPIVLFLGTAAYDKGAHHSLEAMTRLWRRGSAATMVFAGPVMDQFRSFFERQPREIKEQTLLLGFISEEEKRDLLAACNVLVLPSRTDSFGIVLPEAWLYSKPVIGARAGGIPAVIDDGEDGFLVAFGDVSALAERIQQLLQDTALAQRMGEQGKRKTLAHLSWDSKYARIRQVYERLAATGGRRGA